MNNANTGFAYSLPQEWSRKSKSRTASFDASYGYMTASW